MSQFSNIIKGRFAPSPSGRMHLGNVLCALLSWVSAKSRGGEVILRIEDLDRDRCPRKYADTLEEDLRWLGLIYDEGGSESGPNASYYQSERDAIYEVYFQKLMDRIYPCFCSRAALHAASAPHLSDGRIIYAGTCRDMTPEQIAEASITRTPSWRIRVPERTITFTDHIQGIQSMALDRECCDFIVRRADGVFAYQLAVVIDDALMGVNEVVRGRDLLTSTPQQIWLYEALGFPVPQFYHIPLITAPDGRRLSKRDKDLDLLVLREKYTAEELIGLLAHLCRQLEKPEPITAQELASIFDWNKVPTEDIRLTEAFYNA